MHAVACIYSPQDGFSSGEKFCTLCTIYFHDWHTSSDFCNDWQFNIPRFINLIEMKSETVNSCTQSLLRILVGLALTMLANSLLHVCVYRCIQNLISVSIFFYTKWSLMSPDHPGNIIPITVVQNITSLINSLKPLYILFFYHLS